MISLLCPSRGRPEFAKRMIDSANATSASNIEIRLYLNDDDPKLQEYKNLIDASYYEIGPDRSPGYSWNMLAEKANYEYLFLVGDDVNFVTHHWDQKILNAFKAYPDKIACVYPTSPGVKTKKNPHFCLHKNWMDALGYFVPPQFWHWYVDTWTRELAKKIKRYHLVEDFVLEIEKDYPDETAKRTHKMCLRERDHYMWDRTTRRWLDTDANELKKYIRSYR